LLQSHEICFRVHRPLVKYIFIVFTIYQFLWGRFFIINVNFILIL